MEKWVWIFKDKLVLDDLEKQNEEENKQTSESKDIRKQKLPELNQNEESNGEDQHQLW